MSALPKPTTNNVIDFNTFSKIIIKGGLSKSKVKFNNADVVSKRYGGKSAGVSSEVYPFTSKEEIKSMIDVFDKHIDEALDENKKQIAARNKMLFLIGINLGIRASDLCELKYSFFMNDDGTFKEFYSLQPKKTKKTGKYVKLFFNATVKKAITEYLESYPMENKDEYLFKSRKGDSHITEKSLGRIIKDAAEEVGIEQNICSHSLRKTFGFWAWHNAEDKNKALVILQKIFNHSDTATTARYIGITNDEMSDVFNGLNLGLDFLE